MVRERCKLAAAHGVSLWQVDREGRGSITPEAIGVFLADLGLAASAFDLRHIMAELDPGHSGVVSRAAFISFIRHGGQPAQPSPQVRSL